MKLIWQHLTSGLVYARSFRLIPALVGTVIPFFWQLVNLYGTLPAVLLIVGVFQIIIVSMSAIMYPFLFWKLRFLEVYCLAAVIMLVAIISWQVINIIANRRAGFKLIKLQFSTRTALLLLGLLLGHRLIPLSVSPRTVFWDLHLKPHLAGQLRSRSREEIIAAIRHDYQQAANLMEDAIFFGCSPGSFRKLLIAAGLKESQFVMMKTIIPTEHSSIFGLRRPFFFYVIFVHDQASPEYKSQHL
jgi:xanthosine utilization system XapX-like protein